MTPTLLPDIHSGGSSASGDICRGKGVGRHILGKARSLCEPDHVEWTIKAYTEAWEYRSPALSHHCGALQPSGYIMMKRAVLWGLCVVWMSLSTLLILVNKHIMVDLRFGYPMSLASLGMLISTVCCWCWYRFSNLSSGKRSLSASIYITRIVPVGLMMAVTLQSGNITYLYLTVSLIQMLKSLTPVITMLLAFAVQLEHPTWPLVSSVVTISGGILLASYGEMNLSVVGFLFMFASQISEALRLIMTEKLLVGMKLHPIEALMYLAPACCSWLALGVCFYELPDMVAHKRTDFIMQNPRLMLLAACLGFVVNALSYTIIKLSSSLTFKVLGTVKDIIVVTIGILILHETVTGIQRTGYMISLVGFLWYQYIKHASP